MILRSTGLLKAYAGKGWYIGKFDPIANLRFLGPILEISTFVELEVVFETRLALEPLFARRAAIHISKDGLEKAEQILQAMKVAEHEMDFDKFRQCDKLFHALLAQESNSGMLYFLGAMLNNLFFSYWQANTRNPDSGFGVHRAILSAVKAKDSGLAEQLMVDHIESTKEFLDKTLGKS